MKKMLDYFFVFVISAFFVQNVLAADKISVTSIELDSKSDSAIINNDAKVDGFDVSIDVSFVSKDDYVRYKFTLENSTDDNYIINSNINNDDDSNLYYELDIDEKINSNSSSTGYITVRYKKAVDDNLFKDGKYRINEKVLSGINIKLEKSGGTNPKTYDNMFTYLILFIISAIVLSFLCFYKIRRKKIILITVLCLSLVSVGIITANATNIIKINFNLSVDIFQDANNDNIADIDQYVSVSYNAGEHGTINGEKSYTTKSIYLPGKDKYPKAPDVEAKEGYKFNGWTPNYSSETVIQTENIILSYTATYIKDSNNNNVDDKDELVSITYNAGEHGTINGEKSYTTEKKYLPGKDKYPTAPEVEPHEGYKFKSWEPNYSSETVIQAENAILSYTAQYYADMNGNNIEDKEELVSITYNAGEHGTINGKTSYTTEPIYLPNYSYYPTAPGIDVDVEEYWSLKYWHLLNESVAVSNTKVGFENNNLYAYYEPKTAISISNSYSNVDYIVAENNAYINTEYVPNDKTKIEISYSLVAKEEYETLSSSTNALAVFGVFAAGSTRMQIYSITPNKISYGFGDKTNKLSIETEKRINATFDVPKKKVTVDSNSYDINEFVSPNKPIYLFKSNNPIDIPQLTNNVKIYSFKVYEDDNVILDLIPVKDNQTGKYVFYDKINERIFGNASKEGQLSYYNQESDVEITVEKNPNLVIVVPQGVSVNVYHGNSNTNDTLSNSRSLLSTVDEWKVLRKNKTQIKETPLKVVNGSDTLYYYNVQEGGYYYETYGNNYYNLAKDFLIEDEDGKTKIIKVNTSKREGNGYEASYVQNFSDDLEQQIEKRLHNSLDEYKSIFNTPGFAKNNHVFSSLNDVNSFVNSIDTENDNLYKYTLELDNEKEIPVIIFTKDDYCKNVDLDTCATHLSNSEKLNVGYIAQIHGNETAATEGALAVINSIAGKNTDKDLSTLLDKINIYIVPQLNIIGSYNFNRRTTGDMDINRDNLNVSTKENALAHHVYNLIKPEVVIDTHETGSSGGSPFYDMFYGIVYTLNNPKGLKNNNQDKYDSINDVSVSLLQDLMTKASDKQFYPSAYKEPSLNTNGSGYVSTLNFATNRGYYGLYGSASLLIETYGIGRGKELFNRRVLAQYFSVEHALKYAYNNSTDIKSVVSKSRDKIIDMGTTYDANSKLILKHSYDKNNSESVVEYSVPVFNYFTGEPIYNNQNSFGTEYGYIFSQADLSAARPTAYIIPKDANNAADVVDKLYKNGILCYTTPNNSRYDVQSYDVGASSISYNPETELKTFENGAYICTMNQIGANVLAASLDPSFKDYANITYLPRENLKYTYDNKTYYNIYRSSVNLVNCSDSDNCINGKKLPVSSN